MLITYKAFIYSYVTKTLSHIYILTLCKNLTIQVSFVRKIYTLNTNKQKITVINSQNINLKFTILNSADRPIFTYNYILSHIINTDTILKSGY